MLEKIKLYCSEKKNQDSVNSIKQSGAKFLLWVGRFVSWACVAFIGLRFYKLWGDLSHIQLKRSEFLFLVGATFFFSFITYFYCSMWGQMVTFLSGRRMPFGDLAYLFAKANLAKYLPGNVMHYVSRSLLAKKHDIPIKTTVWASILDAGLIVFSALVFVLLGVRERFFVFFSPVRLLTLSVFFIFSLVCLLVLCYFLRKNTTMPLNRKLLLLFLRMSLLYYLYYFLYSGVFGITLSIISKKAFASFAEFFDLAGLFTMAWLIGYVTPGASGGIGVREVALMQLLQGLYPQNTILASALLFRVLTIAAEVLAYAFSFLWKSD